MKKSNRKDVKKTLAPFRKRIDAIDDQILKLLRTRFGIVRRVGAIKARNGFVVEQTDRVREVIERNARTAKKYGISPALIRTIYALMIDEAHVMERGIGKKILKARKDGR